MNLTEIIKDRSFVGGHHIRIREEDFRAFIDQNDVQKTSPEPAWFVRDALLAFTGISVVFDDRLAPNAWHLCPNGKPDAIVASGEVNP
jgi:hypothetical protein